MTKLIENNTTERLSVRKAAQEVFQINDGRSNKILDLLIAEADSFPNSDDQVELSKHLQWCVRRKKGLSRTEVMFAGFIIGAVFVQSY
jgi:hypothetical protein